MAEQEDQLTMSKTRGNPVVGSQSMEIPRCILRRDDLSGCEKVTLMALYLYANKSQLEVWPSNPTLVEDTGQSLNTIERHLQKLEKLGLIRRTKGGVGRVITLASGGTPPLDLGVPTPTSEGTHPHQRGSLHYRNQPMNRRGRSAESEVSVPSPSQVTEVGQQPTLPGCPEPRGGAERPRRESNPSKIDEWSGLLQTIHTACKRRTYGENQAESKITKVHRDKIKKLIESGYTIEQAFRVFEHLALEVGSRKNQLDEGKHVSGKQTAMFFFTTTRCLQPEYFQTTLELADERKSIDTSAPRE